PKTRIGREDAVCRSREGRKPVVINKLNRVIRIWVGSEDKVRPFSRDIFRCVIRSPIWILLIDPLSALTIKIRIGSSRADIGVFELDVVRGNGNGSRGYGGCHCGFHSPVSQIVVDPVIGQCNEISNGRSKISAVQKVSYT